MRTTFFSMFGDFSMCSIFTKNIFAQQMLTDVANDPSLLKSVTIHHATCVYDYDIETKTRLNGRSPKSQDQQKHFNAGQM